MRPTGFEGDAGKRRGKRRHKGRGGFSNSNAGFVMPPAAPASRVAPPVTPPELVETAVIDNLPEPWQEVVDASLEHADSDLAVAVAEEPVDIELHTEPPLPSDAGLDEELLLLDELTRPDPPLTAEPAVIMAEPAPTVAEPAPIVAATAPIVEDSAPAAVETVSPPVESAPAALQPAPIIVPPAPQAVAAPPHTERESVIEPGPDARSESAAEQLVALQAELLEKDQLLAALTAQLEEAANRLDRLHRAGADRAPRRSGPSLSAEALERQSELTDQVARLADAWDEWRAADQMAELGRKLDDLCHMVTQNARPVAAPPRDVTSSRLSESWTGEFTLPPPTDKQLPKWEQMKAQLLGDSAIIEQQWDVPPQAEFPAGSQPEIDLGVVVEPIGEPPAAVNVDSADVDTLKRAVEKRDEFISQLLRRLRSTSACRREPIDWAAIANAPEDLRSRLQELEARFQELLRIEECDMSLERARLAREHARLEQLRRELEKNGGHGGAGSASTENDDSRRERRWLRVFSFGGKRDDDLD